MRGTLTSKSNYFAVLEAETPISPPTPQGRSTVFAPPEDDEVLSSLMEGGDYGSTEAGGAKPRPAGKGAKGKMGSKINSREHRQQLTPDEGMGEAPSSDSALGVRKNWRKMSVAFKAISAFGSAVDSAEAWSCVEGSSVEGSASKSGKRKKKKRANTKVESRNAQKNWKHMSLIFKATSALGGFAKSSAEPTPAPSSTASPAAGGGGSQGLQRWHKATNKVAAVTRFAHAVRSTTELAKDTASTFTERAVDTAANLGLRAAESMVTMAAERASEMARESQPVAVPTLDVQQATATTRSSSAAKKKWRKVGLAVSVTSAFRDGLAAPTPRSSSDVTPRESMDELNGALSPPETPPSQASTPNNPTPQQRRLLATQEKLRRTVMKVKAMNRFKLPDRIDTKAAATTQSVPKLEKKTKMVHQMAKLMKNQFKEELSKERKQFWWSVQSLLIGIFIPLFVCTVTNFSGVSRDIRLLRKTMEVFPQSHAIYLPAAEDAWKDYHQTEHTLIQWQKDLKAVQSEGLRSLGGEVVTVDDNQLEFEFNTMAPGQKAVSISWMFLVHAILSIAAYTTKHAGTAIAAIGMNIPLLWLTVSVKRLDDANYDVVSTMSSVLMEFIELPMGKTPNEIQSYNTCLTKMQVIVNFWQNQNLGIAVLVPGMGRLTLNLAVLVSVFLASAGALLVFSKEVRMVPYLMKAGKAVLVDAAVALHGKCLHRISSKDSLKVDSPLCKSPSASSLSRVSSKENLRKVSNDERTQRDTNSPGNSNNGAAMLKPANSPGLKKVPSKSLLNGKPPRPS